MKLYLIRHGLTKGNEQKRYVGSTDESLSRVGMESLHQRQHSFQNILADIIYVSPMKRCVETARILFPDKKYKVVEDWKECDFGRFEYHNYQELKEVKEYQQWIDSGGLATFPEGESIEQFKKRCQEAFFVEMEDKKDTDVIVMVVHGGTIMAILDQISYPHQEYFSWQVGNGEGFMGEYDIVHHRLKKIQKI